MDEEQQFISMGSLQIAFLIRDCLLTHNRSRESHLEREKRLKQQHSGKQRWRQNSCWGTWRFLVLDYVSLWGQSSVLSLGSTKNPDILIIYTFVFLWLVWEFYLHAKETWIGYKFLISSQQCLYILGFKNIYGKKDQALYLLPLAQWKQSWAYNNYFLT